MNRDLELKLLLYKEVKISEGLTFIQPTIENIIDIGYYDFMTGIYLFFNPKDLLIENKKLYDYFENNEMDGYDVLSYLLDSDKDCRDIINKFLDYHFKEKFKIDNGKIKLGDTIISSDLYSKICNVISICYYLEERLDDKNFGNKIAKTTMINIIRNRRKQAKRHGVVKDSKNPLSPVISIVRTKKNDNDVLEMSSYQLIDFYKTINREKQYAAALNAGFSGSISLNKIKNIWAGED